MRKMAEIFSGAGVKAGVVVATRVAQHGNLRLWLS